ncbi:hypothetical protein CK495_29695 (plasmid) [Klebsiella pneumoniae]|nr:hypothetical protein CK495_29695 [Klebsiella pneumoniae]
MLALGFVHTSTSCPAKNVYNSAPNEAIYTFLIIPRFYVSTSKSIIKALINMHSFEIQLSPIG